MIKTVLAPLTGTDCDGSVLAASFALVGPQHGHIECLRLLPDPADVIAQSAQTDFGGWMILSDTVAEIEREAQQRTARAHENLANFTAKYGLIRADDPHRGNAVTVSWREEAGDEFDRITAFGRHHDAIVLAGGADRAGRLPEEAIGGIVIGAGRPVFLAPQTARAQPFRKIAIAWKDTAEAARAITAAMPLLEKSAAIELFSVHEGGAKLSAEYEPMLRYLRWHGFNANQHVLTAGDQSPADAVVAGARDAGADLLVMGAYGHSRLREFAFGGFTRRVLEGVDLPLFLFH